MPKLTLFDAQTVGVDMKTNPLFVGAKRLHAATNLVFSEGVVKTRPGFSYNLTRAMGCFQGAAEFFPKKGLSVESFSEVEGGIAVVAGGKLYFNCAEVLGMVLPSTGDVNLYQAENYLIIQHADVATYWWDGVNAPVKSIGMNEQDWEDPSTDFVEVEVVPPVSNIPECENFDYTNIVVDFLVIDHITEEIIPLPGYTIKLKNNRVAYGTGTVGGRFNFKASKKTYTYTVEKEGYVSVVDKSLKVTESKSVVVRLEQAEELVCSVLINSVSASDAPDYYAGQFNILNDGNVDVSILSLSGDVSFFNTTPSLPFVISPGASRIIALHAEVSLSEQSLVVNTSCGTTTEIVFPPSTYDCSVCDVPIRTDTSYNAGRTVCSFLLENTNEFCPVTVENYTHFSPGGTPLVIAPTFPRVIPPGESLAMTITSVSGNLSGYSPDFTYETSCGSGSDSFDFA
jgi:hypothetical protein